jgi:hypothetical protein
MDDQRSALPAGPMVEQASGFNALGFNALGSNAPASTRGYARRGGDAQ